MPLKIHRARRTPGGALPRGPRHALVDQVPQRDSSWHKGVHGALGSVGRAAARAGDQHGFAPGGHILQGPTGGQAGLPELAAPTLAEHNHEVKKIQSQATHQHILPSREGIVVHVCGHVRRQIAGLEASRRASRGLLCRGEAGRDVPQRQHHIMRGKHRAIVKGHAVATGRIWINRYRAGAHMMRALHPGRGLRQGIDPRPDMAQIGAVECPRRVRGASQGTQLGAFRVAEPRAVAHEPPELLKTEARGGGTGRPFRRDRGVKAGGIHEKESVLMRIPHVAGARFMRVNHVDPQPGAGHPAGRSGPRNQPFHRTGPARPSSNDDHSARRGIGVVLAPTLRTFALLHRLLAHSQPL